MALGLATRSIAIGAVGLSLAGCRGAFPMTTPDNLATWSRAPLAPDAAMAQLAQEHSSCRAGLDGDVPITIVLQDRRTASTAAFFTTAPGFFGSCLVSKGGGGGGSSTNVAPTLKGVITVDEQGTDSSAEATVNLLGGLVAPNVTTVKVGLRDATEVIATVSSGYWLSWWPGGEPALVVTAIDSGGAIVAVLDRQADSWVDRSPNE
jgi:hypothetical protein